MEKPDVDKCDHCGKEFEILAMHFVLVNLLNETSTLLKCPHCQRLQTNMPCVTEIEASSKEVVEFMFKDSITPPRYDNVFFKGLEELNKH